MKRYSFMQIKLFMFLLLTVAGAYALIAITETSDAEESLASRLSGRILLQVQSHGEAWYLNPADGKRYFLGRPAQAFEIMKRFGIGAEHSFFSNSCLTDPAKRGRIYLDVGDAGKAYYANVPDGALDYLGRPAEALKVMSKRGLGISEQDIASIPIGTLVAVCPACQDPDAGTAQAVLARTAAAAAQGDIGAAVENFSPEMKKSAEYSLEHLSDTSRKYFASILSGARLKEKTGQAGYTFSNTAYFSLGAKDIEILIKVAKSADGRWLITSL